MHGVWCCIFKLFSSGNNNVLDITDSALQVGLYWQALSDADDGVVKNNKQDAVKFIIQKAKELNLKPVK